MANTLNCTGCSPSFDSVILQYTGTSATSYQNVLSMYVTATGVGAFQGWSGTNISLGTINVYSNLFLSGYCREYARRYFTTGATGISGGITFVSGSGCTGQGWCKGGDFKIEFSGDPLFWSGWPGTPYGTLTVYDYTRGGIGSVRNVTLPDAVIPTGLMILNPTPNNALNCGFSEYYGFNFKFGLVGTSGYLEHNSTHVYNCSPCSSGSYLPPI